jgi:hypothetical protein
MNPAYKHLSDKLRIAELTVGQIISILGSVIAGLAFAIYLTPFGPYPTLFISVYLVSIPAGSAFLVSLTDFDVWLLIRSMLRYRLASGGYLAGAGDHEHGYQVLADPSDTAGEQDQRLTQIDLSSLWES